MASLLANEEKIRNGDLGLSDTQQAPILLYLNWSKEFVNEHGREPDPAEDFTSSVYDEYKRNSVRTVSTANLGLVALKDPDDYADALKLFLTTSRNLRCPRPEEFKTWFVEEVQNQMSLRLVRASSQFKDVYIEFMKRSVEKRCLASDDEPLDPIVLGGRTQSGKTSFKAICALVCDKLQLPLIIITKGVAESKELHGKLREFTTENDICEKIVTPGRGQPRYYMEQALERKGCAVIADTAAQINRAVKAIATCRKNHMMTHFVVIVDECDDMYRTEDRRQKMEQAYDSLMDKGPMMRIMISATLVPLLANMKEEGESIEWMELIDPLPDYVGIEQMVTLKDDQGSNVFLSKGELTKASHEDIPFYNSKVERLYNHALNSDENVKVVLLLDVSTPRVNVDGNLFEKAEKVQHMPGYENVVVVAIYGGGIKYKASASDSEWKLAERGLRISDVLEAMDKEFGLDRPIFVFGFSKMQRGMSFRSSKRVPSHILLALGDGHSAEGMFQALGRATFNGKGLLNDNGFQNVTVLTRHGDWDAARAYQHFLIEIAKNIEKEGLSQAFEMTYSWKSDVLHGHGRKFSKKKSLRGDLESTLRFDEPDSDDEELSNLRSGYVYATMVLSRNPLGEKVYRTVCELANREKYAMLTGRIYLPTSEIQDEFDNDYNETIGIGRLKKELRWLCGKGFLLQSGDQWSPKTTKKRKRSSNGDSMEL